MKTIYYFTNNNFNYTVDENYFQQLLDEDYFLRFDECYILSLLKETLELDEFFLDDVFDDIRELSWHGWNGKQNYLSKETVDKINKEYNISLTVDDFGEIMYYDESGGCTEITYTEAQTGEGSWDDDTTLRHFVTAGNLNVGQLLNILERDKDAFIDALKERNADFGEFIENIKDDDFALEEVLIYFNTYDDHFYYENSERLSEFLSKEKIWLVIDDNLEQVNKEPLTYNDAKSQSHYAIVMERDE